MDVYTWYHLSAPKRARAPEEEEQSTWSAKPFVCQNPPVVMHAISPLSVVSPVIRSYRIDGVGFFDGYQLDDEVKRGSYGTVFILEKRGDPSVQVALKVFTNQSNAADELKLINQYKHMCAGMKIDACEVLVRAGYAGAPPSESRAVIMQRAVTLQDHIMAEKHNLAMIPGDQLQRVKIIHKVLSDVVKGLLCLSGEGGYYTDIKMDNLLWVDGTVVLGDLGSIYRRQDGGHAMTTYGFIDRSRHVGTNRYITFILDGLIYLAWELTRVLFGIELSLKHADGAVDLVGEMGESLITDFDRNLFIPGPYGDLKDEVLIKIAKLADDHDIDGRILKAKKSIGALDLSEWE